jgi:hypothetical protein
MHLRQLAASANILLGQRQRLKLMEAQFLGDPDAGRVRQRQLVRGVFQHDLEDAGIAQIELVRWVVDRGGGR